MPFFPGQLGQGILVSVKVPSMNQIDLFKNYLYLIGIIDIIILYSNDIWLEDLKLKNSA